MDWGERYFAQVERRGPTECWPWTGLCSPDGYGRFSGELAHRVGWIIHFGPIPPEKPCVLHTCDNPPCQNPAHWFSGTRADNNADMIAKGRYRNGQPLGSRNRGTAKLTDEEVIALRAEATGVRGDGRRLAAKYGIGTAQVSRILSGTRR